MQTLSDIVAAVVVSSSTAAFSHFGVVLEPPKVERPPVERTVNRAPPPKTAKAVAMVAPTRIENVRSGHLPTPERL